MFKVRLGLPEMDAMWSDLNAKAVPGLNSHEIDPMTSRYGMKVFQSYLENQTPGAGRLYWVYGPGKGEIRVIGLEPHPEDKKSSGSAKVKLSALARNCLRFKILFVV
jgi:hypothetical protein